jgi:hypothetical protein
VTLKQLSAEEVAERYLAAVDAHFHNEIGQCVPYRVGIRSRPGRIERSKNDPHVEERPAYAIPSAPAGCPGRPFLAAAAMAGDSGQTIRARMSTLTVSCANTSDTERG